ncbi:MAG: glycosyltransferase [Bacteroidetes bacterium]|nr:glycosyltransferase [Bacteroidota bacterium]
MAKVKNTVSSVSVVIATLGGESLRAAIECLNAGSHVPDEILVCIPKEYAGNVEGIEFDNLKVILTDCRGQVAQRVIGFQNAKSPFVLQMDDDIYLEHSCIDELLKIVSSAPNIAAGPKMYDLYSGKYHSFLVPRDNTLILFNKLFYAVANGKKGYQPSKISKSGINFGIPEEPDTWNNVDWLSGGCLMHRKENLLLYNYYPFTGKAYAEDLFHSNLLRKNKIILVRSGKASCKVDFRSSKGNLFEMIWNYSKPIIPMKYFVKSINGSLPRLYATIFLTAIRLILSKIHNMRAI